MAYGWLTDGSVTICHLILMICSFCSSILHSLEMCFVVYGFQHVYHIFYIKFAEISLHSLSPLSKTLFIWLTLQLKVCVIFIAWFRVSWFSYAHNWRDVACTGTVNSVSNENCKCNYRKILAGVCIVEKRKSNNNNI